MSSDDDHEGGLDMFAEPKGFRPATPPPTEARYDFPKSVGGSSSSLTSSEPIIMSLVGSHPLWGHHLWNAAPTLSDYLVREMPQLCSGKTVLELGAAAGLPSIVAHRLKASVVVSTDYPDNDLIENLRKNCDGNTSSTDYKLAVEGYIWGSDTSKLKALLPKGQQYFDLLLLSDLIFNHQAHPAMLATLDSCLPPSRQTPSGQDTEESSYAGPQALVFFTHHRPHLAHKDMEFFEQARQKGWICTEVGKWKMAPMFPEDPGSEEVRATVHGWQIYR
ncbi:uncharacterized protein FA14DRAFT_164120 [Meira miltonrushii]|uniref:Elongation factor methyltransferase 7 n=1 Tax=Meira miltonrushii TaxID=1280837 RepID=A0A316VHK7_9BASI|nr:uncharacterized protein FA14DRAFT_164120 [Meira miltonrushii]PWN34985.1 hypothetical protein FA14DRAFT_164120 [Meira miltonrushii]